MKIAPPKSILEFSGYFSMILFQLLLTYQVPLTPKLQISQVVPYTFHLKEVRDKLYMGGYPSTCRLPSRLLHDIQVNSKLGLSGSLSMTYLDAQNPSKFALLRPWQWLR